MATGTATPPAPVTVAHATFRPLVVRPPRFALRVVLCCLVSLRPVVSWRRGKRRLRRTVPSYVHPGMGPKALVNDSDTGYTQTSVR